jgi:hypothetical protein
MIEGILQKSKETKSLVGFNFYGSDGGFYCGYVLDYNSEFVIIQHFSKFGIYDGILVHKLSDIKYFETETDYLKGINTLIQHKDIMMKQAYSYNKHKNVLDNFTNLFESFIGNKEQIIKFELNDDDIYFGFIEWCDEDSFSIINLENDGSIVGKAIFKFEDLKAYWIDDLECRKRQVLYHAAKRNG